MMATCPRPRQWFTAKSFGWGWGLPLTWEGWVITVAFLLVVIAGALVLPRRGSLAVTAIAAVGLLATLLAKGEPPRWRWGRRGS